MRIYWKSNKQSINAPCAVKEVYQDKGWKGWADFLDKEDK